MESIRGDLEQGMNAAGSADSNHDLSKVPMIRNTLIISNGTQDEQTPQTAERKLGFLKRITNKLTMNFQDYVDNNKGEEDSDQ
jgi:hypothetical protein